MGWKRTINITRERAISLLNFPRLAEELSNEQLSDLMEARGYGDDQDKPYYGHNFYVVSEDEGDIDGKILAVIKG